MMRVGDISSEGGPLVFLDWDTARHWSGEECGPDFQRACAVVESQSDGGSMMFADAHDAVVWNMGGAGTANVFKPTDAVVALVRTWPDDPDEAPDPAVAEAEGTSAVELGTLDVSSGFVVVLWAAEVGAEAVGDSVPKEGPVPGDLAIDGGGMVLSVEPGRYKVVADEVLQDELPARRCRLTRVADADLDGER